jgi:hypothetical protein
MPGESDNLPTGGTDTAHSLSLDQAANLDVYDPSEDNVEDEQAQQSGAETDEAEGQEADETETAEDDDTTEAEGEEADESANPEPEDDVTVTMNGERLALSELKAGYLRQQDYSRKTQEAANVRRHLEALSARVTSSVDVIADFLVQQIPEAPHPSLAMTDPGRFVQLKAAHEAAMGQVNALLQQAGEVKGVSNQLTGQQRMDVIAHQNAKLAEAFPTTKTDEGRKKFFDKAAAAARELGYSEEEIASALDHRMFAMAHYAAIGKAAEQAKAKAVKKVENVPPVAQQKRRPGDNASQSARNREAMKRLSRTGSIADALAIDFD